MPAFPASPVLRTVFAFFLRGKLMVARSLFSMLPAHCPKKWYLNFQAFLRRHARPLANAERKRKRNGRKTEFRSFRWFPCGCLSVLANGRTCPRIKSWKFRYHFFGQWGGSIERRDRATISFPRRTNAKTARKNGDVWSAGLVLL